MQRRSAQESGEALPQIAFRRDRRQFETAVQHPVNDRANHRGTGQRVAGFLPDDVDRGVKSDYLSIK